MKIKAAIVSLIFLFCCSLSSRAQNVAKEHKVAILVGATDYNNDVKMEHPKNDVSDMALVLKEGGYDSVMTVVNKDAQEMLESLKKFGEMGKEANMSMIYFSMCAYRINGETFLVSSNRSIKNISDIACEAVSLSAVLDVVRQMNASAAVVILDVTELPLPPGRKSSIASAYDGMFPPPNCMVASCISTSVKEKIMPGRNSAYTGCLLMFMERRDLSLYQVLVNAGDELQLWRGFVRNPLLTGAMSRDVSIFGNRSDMHQQDNDDKFGDSTLKSFVLAGNVR